MRAIAHALLLVLALLAAPATSALRRECDLCPRTCPMHRGRDAAKPAPAHLGCHGAPAAAHQASNEPHRRPAMSRPPCTTHGAIAAIALPPVVLPTRDSLPQLAATRGREPIRDALRGRTGDPPDTPPPIAVA